ncbi:MAG: hypothetical protein Q8O58_12210 [Gallionella sp.]|nr:hypothetical protein [Gallionella sp.]
MAYLSTAGAVFANNIVMVKILGFCPFMQVQRGLTPTAAHIISLNR